MCSMADENLRVSGQAECIYVRRGLVSPGKEGYDGSKRSVYLPNLGNRK